MKHHPDIELLLKYANGLLSPSVAIAISIHQQSCELCQKRIAEIESIGGETMDTRSSSDEKKSRNEVGRASSDSFDKLLNEVAGIKQIEEKDDFEECVVAEMDKPILEKLNNRDFSQFQWRKVTRNLKKAEVNIEEEENNVELLRIAPCAKIPMHTHEGEEITVVLQGEFSDSQSSYKRGDFIIQDSSNKHSPVAGKDGCVCLAITTAPLKFTGMLGPFFNWFAR